MNEFEQLLAPQESAHLLESIEMAAWSIAGLLVIAIAVLYFGLVKRRLGEHRKESDWSKIVDNAYEGRAV